MHNLTRRDVLLKGTAWLSLGLACAAVTGFAAASPAAPAGTAMASGHTAHQHSGPKVRKRLRIKAKRKDKNPHRVFDVAFDESDTAITGVTVDAKAQDFQAMKDATGVMSHLRPFDEPYRTSEDLMEALIEFYEYDGFSMA